MLRHYMVYNNKIIKLYKYTRNLLIYKKLKQYGSYKFERCPISPPFIYEKALFSPQLKAIRGHNRQASSNREIPAHP